MGEIWGGGLRAGRGALMGAGLYGGRLAGGVVDPGCGGPEGER